MSVTSEIRMDAPTVGAFQRELEYKESQVIQRLRPEYPAANGKLFQIDEQNLSWAESTSFTTIDGVGMFELGRGQATNLPYVEMVGEQFYQGTYSYRNGYYFSEKEVAATLHRGMPIEEQKILLVQQSYIETMNKLLLFGDRQTGLPGFFNHPSWLRSVALYKLDGSTMNANNVLAVLNAGVQGGKKATNKIIKYDTLLLPENRYDFLMSQFRMNDFQEKSVLRYFLENNPSITDIQPMAELEDAGPNGEAVAIFYKRDPSYFKARVTDPFRPRPLMQVDPWNVYRGYSFDYNGIIVYRRYAAHVVIGV
jgi:hypothetical protein